jgi:hypothetical protein
MNKSKLGVSKQTSIIAVLLFLVVCFKEFSTIVGPWASYLIPPSASDGLNPKLLGLWHEEFEYPQLGGVVGFEGTIEYFRNKTYRINGLLKSTTFASPSSALATTSYKFDGNGEWLASDEELETSLMDVRIRVVARTRGHISIPRAPSPNTEESEIERGLLLAKSQRYDIRSTGKNEVVLESNGLFADSYVIRLNRTKQMYMR